MTEHPEGESPPYLNGLSQDMKTVVLNRHAQAIRGYSERRGHHTGAVTNANKNNRRLRMKEFLTISQSSHMDGRELVNTLTKGSFTFNDCTCQGCLPGSDQTG